MGGWIKVDDLKPTAKTLALAAEAIEDASGQAPAVTPDAGDSTQELGKALTDVFQAIGHLASSLAAAADSVEHANSSYHGVDQHTAGTLTDTAGPNRSRAVK